VERKKKIKRGIAREVWRYGMDLREEEKKCKE
jgi:hypothetical protein